MSSRGRSNKGSNAGGGDSDANGGATNGAIGGITEGGATGGLRVVVTDETVEPEASFPGQSCRVCRREDNEQMVRCDKCLKWFHFICVGVTQAIEDVPWSCAGCESSTQNANLQLNPAGVAASHGGTKKKSTVAEDNTASTHLQPSGQVTPKTSNTIKPSQTKPKKTTKKLSKDKSPMLESVPPKDGHSQMDSYKFPSKNIEPALEVGEQQYYSIKYPSKIVEPPVRKANSVSSHTSSHASSRSSQSIAKLKLQKLEEERILNSKKLEQERLYLEEKYRLLEQMASDSGSDVHSQLDVVSRWLPRAESSQRSLVPEPVHLAANSVVNLRTRAGEEALRSAQRELPQYQPAANQAFEDEHRSGVREVPQHASRLPEYDEDRCQLTKKQLAARQAVSKDLPPFSGNPEDWPLFIATFNNTTAMCGFTNDENIFRLQKSLKGRAFEAVKSRLVHPANVPGVLKTLKMMFGQPEAIVHTLIEKIHALPAIREDRLETLVDFAVSIENFCATVDACGLDEYLYNSTLLHQLVSKLPPTIKLNWAQYRIALPGVNLASFSTWIYSLAEAASAFLRWTHFQQV